jgi:hypothetical protein
MKNISILIIIFFAITSCKKESVVDLDTFRVVMTKIPTKVGDTAFFSIQGNPDFITFYSGERGRNYNFKDRIVAENSIPNIIFTTFGQGLSSQFPNSLSLMISTNYNGNSTDIKSATWTDITRRAILSAGTTGTSSGTIDLSDFRKFDSVYIGFRYNAASSFTSSQPTWTIQSFNVNNLSLPDSTVYNIRTISMQGWQTIDLSNSVNTWQVSSSQLRITGGAANALANEDWVIAKVRLSEVTPDFGLPVKNIVEKVNSYFYIFSKAGSYKVTFLASANRSNLDKSVIQQFDITIK